MDLMKSVHLSLNLKNNHPAKMDLSTSLDIPGLLESYNQQSARAGEDKD